MNRDTYTVKVGSEEVAQHMAIDMAMLLTEALFGHRHYDATLAVTIEREGNKLCSGGEVLTKE